MGIFSDNAPKLWKAGLPVMPLREKSKRPFLTGWSLWQNRMPRPDEQKDWLEKHGDGNIGLVLGPQSRMFALDIDTDDPAVLHLVRQLVPPSPWERVGAKGLVMAFRYADQPLTHIQYRVPEGQEGAGKLKGLIDMLGAGSQVVLPPSIHPDTGREYWATSDLADVIGDLPLLPSTFDAQLRDGLKALGWPIVDGGGNKGVTAVTDYCSVGNRDTQLVGTAGMFARDVMYGRRTLGQAIAQIQVKIAEFMERTYGDDIPPAKGVEKLIEFVKRDMKERPLPRGWSDDMSEEDLAACGMGAEELSADDVVWEPEDIRAEFTEAVSVPGVKDSPELMLKAAVVAIGRVGRQQNMAPIEEESLLKYIVDMSGKKFTLAGVRKQLARTKQGPIEGLSHSQIADASLTKMEELGGEIRCWNEILWQYNGSHWQKMDEKEVLKDVINEFGQLKAGLRANDHSGIIRTIKNLRTAELCQRVGVNGINFVNGFLGPDLVLVDHDPDYGMTYSLPYAYEPDKLGECPKFMALLCRYWGGEEDYLEKVECLGELIALTMFGMMTSAQTAVCLYGVGQSGKSRIIEILLRLMPPEATVTVPPHSWGERFSVVHLVGKLLNFAGELSENAYIDGTKFKTIISGEPVDAEEKGQPKFNFRPKCGHWFSTNHLPKSRDSSEGFTRRWIFLQFKRRIPDNEVIQDIEVEIVSEEREAIVAWAVNHMIKLRAKNFRITDPMSSARIRGTLENELNNVRSFLWDFQQNGRMLLGVQDHENAITGPGGAVLGSQPNAALGNEVNCSPSDTLYHAYRSYCVAQAVSPVGSKGFMKRMEMLEGVFGFTCENLKNPAGLFIPVYRYATLVDPMVAKRKVSNKS